MLTHSNCAVPAVSNAVRDTIALFIAGPPVHCGLKYQHWPM